ncbi:MAG: PepSY-like domain-containing protein [Muribaculaceae bacterium]|nr:PepSY-like domain-containing protein [Muribaculaceae bacterium]MDE7394058.1 PepSY-like domain-containing protein [Muribaculaceae bacterium]
MKNTSRIATVMAAAALVVAGVSTATAQVPRINGGVSPVTAASTTTSTLPKKAQKFIDKHFAGVAVASTEVDFPSQDIDVKLANGIEIEFSQKGELKEIETEQGSLSVDLVKSILPRETYRDLRDKGMQACVEGIKKDKYGYKVDLNNQRYDEARYNVEGFFVAFYE